jgi:hypothetical protein
MKSIQHNNRVGVRSVEGHAATLRSDELPFEDFFGRKRRIVDDEVKRNFIPSRRPGDLPWKKVEEMPNYKPNRISPYMGPKSVPVYESKRALPAELTKGLFGLRADQHRATRSVSAMVMTTTSSSMTSSSATTTLRSSQTLAAAGAALSSTQPLVSSTSTVTGSGATTTTATGLVTTMTRPMSSASTIRYSSHIDSHSCACADYHLFSV